ncbi:MAG: flagellar basal-body MS-ring/collar protein FliF [Paracoccaceae bacterium]
MQQILSVWSNLDPRRRIIVVFATLAMFAAVIGLSKMASKPSMELLYAGLESGPAGEVVQALEARGVVYDIRGASIFVESSRRDELRMTLASDGLPTNSSQGYELLDNLSGFGTTSQMFDAAYWRAKEGELARTIVSSPLIRSARVHLGNPTGSAFARQSKPTASVTITTAEGALPARHAKALKFLVASAISGLAPDDVSVIDGRGGLVMSGDEALAGAPDSNNRAMELKQNAERLLAARLGYGNSVVEITVETQTDREQIFERRFDPEGRVAISSETEERSTSATDTRSADVTVASNLPAGEGGSGGDSNSQDSETRELVNYEVSETKREILRTPGAIKKLSVAVLLDGIRTVDPDSGEETWTTRTPGEIEDLRELVASAVGLDESRGDTLTMKTLQFEPLETAGTTGSVGFLQSLHLDIMGLVQLAVLALVSLVLGLFVLRPILASGSQSNATPALAPPAENNAQPSQTNASQSTAIAPIPIPDAPPNLPALNGEIDEGNFSAPQMATVSDFDFGDDMPGFSNDPVKRLKQMIEDRQEETVEILRSWMDEEEEKT